ncbi:aminodeoxychorismate/anthranilate synthase component II [Halorubellus sp. JP-L1]|uniref:anthranilate synthase component II n=1 Tax=Halorubellus sp. JP-L1 TaxID=2715753 RepID=UPI00140B3A97|nr:aminodeoxychorismate/anthranilate synthase component II [Halorubellus sp. JP-L1]NHN41384.1 aminodeoxychorismate/anthranilate synthase component II [Halorubellus sp. JP-L1]
MRVLFVDNFDSFTYNLVEYVESSLLATRDPGDVAVEVVRNTASLADVRAFDPDAVVVSPGPGHPRHERDVGVTTDVFREVSPDVPTLGVCLGLEAAVHEYGGTVGRAPEPVHGKAWPIAHDGRGVFVDLEQGFSAGRYHSLVASEVPECFAVTATTDHGDEDASAVDVAADGGVAAGDGGDAGARGVHPDGDSLVMGVRHRDYPIYCVQFHPESVLTGCGHDVIENFLALADD